MAEPLPLVTVMDVAIVVETLPLVSLVTVVGVTTVESLSLVVLVTVVGEVVAEERLNVDVCDVESVVDGPIADVVMEQPSPTNPRIGRQLVTVVDSSLVDVEMGEGVKVLMGSVVNVLESVVAVTDTVADD